MYKKYFYIGIFFLLILIIGGLLGWSIFIGKQQQALKQGTKDLGYYPNTTTNTSSNGGGFFGGVFNNDKSTNEAEDGIPSEESLEKPVLRQLYNLPTAGYIKKRSNAIRFVDVASGHIFEKDLPDGVTSRINQTTVPKVQKALFVNDGNALIRQYVDDEGSIISIFNDLNKKESESSTLTTNILEIVPSPDKKEIAFIMQDQRGSDLLVSQPNGESKSILNSSPLRGWSLDWEKNMILLTQKSTASLPSSAYLIDRDSEKRKLLLQQLKGLATNLSPDGKNVLYSYINTEGVPILNVKGTHVGGTEKSLTVAGLAEKCVWHPNGLKVFCALPKALPKALPDSWYQGIVHFSDSVFEIDISTNKISHIISPETANGVSLDIIDMTLNDLGTVLFFKNKTDQTLWSLTLSKLTDESDSLSGEDGDI